MFIAHGSKSRRLLHHALNMVRKNMSRMSLASQQNETYVEEHLRAAGPTGVDSGDGPSGSLQVFTVSSPKAS